MDRQYVQDNQMVERYLQQKLTDAETEAFEEFYLGDSATLADLEVAEKLQLGLQDCASSGELDGAGDEGGSTTTFFTPLYAQAATVLLVCSLGVSALMYQQQGSDIFYDSTQLVPIFATRSAEPVTISKASDDGWVVFLVDPGFEAYEHYRATVMRVDGDTRREVWQAEGLEPGYEDLLAVGLPGELLQPGYYDVQVEGRNATAEYTEISRFPFRVPHSVE